MEGRKRECIMMEEKLIGEVEKRVESRIKQRDGKKVGWNVRKKG